MRHEVVNVDAIKREYMMHAAFELTARMDARIRAGQSRYFLSHWPILIPADVSVSVKSVPVDMDRYIG
jgi:hypothetical protein